MCLKIEDMSDAEESSDSSGNDLCDTATMIQFLFEMKVSTAPLVEEKIFEYIKQKFVFSGKQKWIIVTQQEANVVLTLLRLTRM